MYSWSNHVKNKQKQTVVIYRDQTTRKHRHNFSAIFLSGEVLVWFCLEQGAYYLHMVQLMPLPPHHHPIISCFIKFQNGLPFWCQLTQAVLEKSH